MAARQDPDDAPGRRPGSQTRGIVLELPNPNNKPAGLRVDVRLVTAMAPARRANAGGQR